jgi:hypothetical protein
MKSGRYATDNPVDELTPCHVCTVRKNSCLTNRKVNGLCRLALRRCVERVLAHWCFGVAVGDFMFFIFILQSLSRVSFATVLSYVDFYEDW